MITLQVTSSREAVASRMQRHQGVLECSKIRNNIAPSKYEQIRCDKVDVRHPVFVQISNDNGEVVDEVVVQVTGQCKKSNKADLVNLEVEVDVLNMQVCLMRAFGLVCIAVSMLDDRTVSNCINFQVSLPSIPSDCCIGHSSQSDSPNSSAIPKHAASGSMGSIMAM